MGKVALLIGVSKYQHGFNPLPGVVKDVAEMQRVLQNPEIGGFEVKTLLNCDRQKMEEAIETFFSNRQKDDLVLLYFSGHGIKDDIGNLYFAIRNTRKSQGELLKATAVAASFIHKTMNSSSSKRKVLILDCCFSGAFGRNMLSKGLIDNDLVNLEKQLGGEGRAVLTSSTSTQPSFDLVYTQWLVKGMKSGEADLDKDGNISVDELHSYAKQKVSQVNPSMTPKIYPIEEGYKIILAKIKPKKWQEYEDYFRKLIQRQPILTRDQREELKRIQESLNLTNEEVERIEKTVIDEQPRPWPGKIKYLYLVGFIGFLSIVIAAVKSLENPGSKILHPPFQTTKPSEVTDTFRDVSNVPEGTFTYSGSGAWTPIHPKIDPEIKKDHPLFILNFKTKDDGGKLEVGSRESISMLLDGGLDFALSNIPISADEKSKANENKFTIEQIPVAKNGVAVAVNPNLNISKLTINQLRNIYTGKIKNWKEVGGPDTKINIYTSGGGTNSSTDWIKNILGIQNQHKLANMKPTEKATDAFNEVANDSGGITLSSASLTVPQCSIKSLPLVGKGNKVVPPYQENNFVPPSQCGSGKRNRVNVQAIYNGDYPLTNDLSVVIKRNGQKEEQAGIAYANLLKTKQGQEIIKELQETGNIDQP